WRLHSVCLVPVDDLPFSVVVNFDPASNRLALAHPDVEMAGNQKVVDLRRSAVMLQTNAVQRCDIRAPAAMKLNLVLSVVLAATSTPRGAQLAFDPKPCLLVEIRATRKCGKLLDVHGSIARFDEHDRENVIRDKWAEQRQAGNRRWLASQTRIS